MNMHWIRPALGLLLATLAGCDPGSGNAGEVEPGVTCQTEVLAEDYGQTCEVNADCVAVYEGEVADPCHCVNAAISAEDLEAYETDLGPDSCHDPANCLADCAAQIGDQGACVEGQCVMGSPYTCGDKSCNGLNEFCVRFGSDIAGEPDGYGCFPLPTECEGSTDCDCFLGTDPGLNIDFCLDLGGCEYSGGGFGVTCPGG